MAAGCATRNPRLRAYHFFLFCEISIMSECPLLEACPFFAANLTDMPTTAEAMKQRFCHGAYEGCARYQVRHAVGKEAVPLNLYPDDLDRAQAIIRSGRDPQRRIIQTPPSGFFKRIELPPES